jgi:integrase
MKLFKPSDTNPIGETKERDNWYVDFRDHNRHRRRLRAFTSKSASEEFGRKLEALAAYRAADLRPQGDLARWLETLPRTLCEQLARIGLLDSQNSAAGKPLGEHLTDYHAGMLAKGDCKSHAQQERHKIETILAGCRFKCWSDLSASRLQLFLAETRTRENLSIRTLNGYLIAFKAFCRWYVQDGRAAESPVQHLRLLAQVDGKRERRALTAEELRKLIGAALAGPDVEGMPGSERAMLYRVAAETGLRWSELYSLKRLSFNLAGKPPTVTVLAAYAKNRREDSLPLRPETAQAVKDYFDGLRLLPAASAFPHMPRYRKGARLMEADLTRAGIPFKDAGGRVADFHSLRHSFVSALARGGVHPKTAQDLARHSDINLTLNTYTHNRASTEIGCPGGAA